MKPIIWQLDNKASLLVKTINETEQAGETSEIIQPCMYRWAICLRIPYLSARCFMALASSFPFHISPTDPSAFNFLGIKFLTLSIFIFFFSFQNPIPTHQDFLSYLYRMEPFMLSFANCYYCCCLTQTI